MTEIGALRKESNEDYVLVDESCWITVENLSVMLKKCDDGLSIYVYALDHEDEDCITETWVLWNEGKEIA